jgi:hypothetical protein
MVNLIRVDLAFMADPVLFATECIVRSKFSHYDTVEL